jgi:polysaccharide biosynthesis protein PslH
LKILQICTKPLFPPYDGGKLAMLNMAKGLASQGAEVVQLMFETPAHLFPGEIPPDYPFRLIKVFIDTRLKIKDALINLIGTESYHLVRFKQKVLQNALVDLLEKEQFDVIQAEGIYALSYVEVIRKHSNGLIILRAHNVEHRIWERAAHSGRNFWIAPYLKTQSKRLRKEELRIANAADGIVTMSEDDLQVFRQLGVKIPACIVGIGTDLKAPENLPDQIGSKNIFHLGAMNWFPNREGVMWFIREVWPQVRKEIPGIRFNLAGHGMPDDINNKNDLAIEVESAADAAAYMLSRGIMIVPLLSGSGIRVKIIEGLKLGKVIVTTYIGAEGLGLQDGREILLAADAKEFSEKLKWCFQEPELARRISENARNFAAKQFDTSQLANQLLRFYQSLIKG